MRKRLRKQIISIIAACMIITVIPVNAVVYGAQIDNSEDSDTEVTIIQRMSMLFQQKLFRETVLVFRRIYVLSMSLRRDIIAAIRWSIL